MSKLISKYLKLILIIVGVLVVLVTGGMLIYLNGIGAVDNDSNKAINVDIPEGSGASAIVEILDENGLVKNKLCAKIHVRISNYPSLQANCYRLNKSMTLPEIFKIINTGDFNYIAMNQFTIIEGATLPQAAEAMAEGLPYTAEEILAVWSDEEYLRKLIDDYWFLTEEILAEGIMFPLEGYIYPETYFITEEDMTIEEITDIIFRQTDEALSARKDEIAAMELSIHEFLTLASIVESESLFEEDRPKIAGVFINRLEQDIALQSDITVLYALQEKRVDVTYDDLEVDSLYNTYMYPGLPVGSVCAVPAHTMDDVLQYEESDYLYFFATEDGKVIYSRTVDEHNKVIEENIWY